MTSPRRSKVYFPAYSLLRNSINCICTRENLIPRLNLPTNSQKRLSRSLAHLQPRVYKALLYALHFNVTCATDTRACSTGGLSPAKPGTTSAITMLQTPFGLRFTSRVIILLFLSMLQVSPPPFAFAFIVLAVVTCELQLARSLLLLPRVCICDGCLGVRFYAS
jgi:hypothetical protein